MGVYCYADDISLLSPTFTGLKEMLKIYEDFADDHDIIFNLKVNYCNLVHVQIILICVKYYVSDHIE